MRVPASREPVARTLPACWQDDDGGDVAPLAVVVAGLRSSPPPWLCLGSPGSLSAKFYFCEKVSFAERDRESLRHKWG